jgi:hypothetical protein
MEVRRLADSFGVKFIPDLVKRDIWVHGFERAYTHEKKY